MQAHPYGEEYQYFVLAADSLFGYLWWSIWNAFFDRSDALRVPHP